MNQGIACILLESLKIRRFIIIITDIPETADEFSTEYGKNLLQDTKSSKTLQNQMHWNSENVKEIPIV